MASNKTVTLPSHFTYAEASRWLTKKESRGFVVTSISITPHPQNSVTLAPHLEGKYPKDCQLLPASAAAPEGHHKAANEQWTVLVEDTPRLSQLWRHD